MLSVGQVAPEFDLPGVHDGSFRTYRLSELTEESVVVLLFYPFDFSPVCNTQLCEFSDAEFLSLTPGVDVVGISADSCYAHRAFKREAGIRFPLLSDSVGEVTAIYGLDYEEWEGHAGVPKRAVLIVDEERRIRWQWMTDDAYQHPDLETLYDAVKDVLGHPIRGPRP